MKKEDQDLIIEFVDEANDSQAATEDTVINEAATEDTVINEAATEKTVIREAVTPKTISETPKVQAKDVVIKESERVGVDEKRPVFITDKGRLPLSVAVETDGGTVSRIAQVGDVLPVKTIREFSVESPDVKTVFLNLYAGERPLASQNKLISKTKLKGIERLPEGRSLITVEFRIDKDCNIKINAIDEGSLRKFSKIIDNSWKPAEDKIFEFINEAKENLKEDNLIRERIRLVQKAREAVFAAENLLKSKKVKLSGNKKHQIKKKCRQLKQRLRKVSIVSMNETTKKEISEGMLSLNSDLAE